MILAITRFGIRCGCEAVFIVWRGGRLIAGIAGMARSYKTSVVPQERAMPAKKP